MKTIPKFPDLMAEADRFVEDTEDNLPSQILERHRYWFKNGYGLSLVRFSPNYYDGSIEVSLLEGSEENFDLSDRTVELFDCKFNDVFRLFEESEVRQVIEYVRDLD